VAHLWTLDLYIISPFHSRPYPTKVDPAWKYCKLPSRTRWISPRKKNKFWCTLRINNDWKSFIQVARVILIYEYSSYIQGRWPIFFGMPLTWVQMHSTSTTMLRWSQFPEVDLVLAGREKSQHCRMEAEWIDYCMTTVIMWQSAQLFPLQTHNEQALTVEQRRGTCLSNIIVTELARLSPIFNCCSLFMWFSFLHFLVFGSMR